MKQCPHCSKTYTDDSLNFCLEDGSPLVPTTVATTTAAATAPEIPSQATVVMERPAPRRKSRAWIWILGILVVVGVVAVSVIGLVAYRLNAERTRVDVATPANSATPKPSAAPKRIPSPSPSASVWSLPETPATPDAEDADEVTPISWSTAAANFKTDVGRKYRFECPPNGTAQAVWGSDIYTADSSICTAAVHAGVIDLEDGGEVTVEFRPGRSIYGSTTRNGIKSSNYGEYPHSIVVR